MVSYFVCHKPQLCLRNRAGKGKKRVRDANSLPFDAISNLDLVGRYASMPIIFR